MKIVNTSRYARKDVGKLIRFALRSVGKKEVGRVEEIVVRNRENSYFSGHAWLQYRRIVISIGPASYFPLQRCARPTMPQYEIRDWKEALLTVAAHEFNHLSQHERGRRSGRWVSRSEHECERAAKQALAEYRGVVV